LSKKCYFFVRSLGVSLTSGLNSSCRVSSIFYIFIIKSLFLKVKMDIFPDFFAIDLEINKCLYVDQRLSLGKSENL